MVRAPPVQDQRFKPNANAIVCQKRVRFGLGNKKRTRDFRRKSLSGKSRENKTAIELFLDGVNGWDRVILSLLDANKPQSKR